MSDHEEIPVDEINFEEEQPKPKKESKQKMDKRSIQSKLNAEKARLTKLEKLRKKKAKERQREVDEAYYESDSDASDTELLVIKKNRNMKVKKSKARPVVKDEPDEDKTDSDLAREIQELKRMMKALKQQQQGEGKNTIINVHPSVHPKENTEFKESILRF